MARSGEPGTLAERAELNRTATCARCSRRLDAEAAVLLWDGRRYCGQCVEAACPGLSQAARGRVRLEEAVAPDAEPTPSKVRWQSLAATVVLLGVAWAAALLAAWLGKFDWKGMLTVSAYVLAFFLPIIVGMWFSLGRSEIAPAATRTATGVVAVENGRVTVRTQTDGRTRERAVPLTECEWYVGHASDDPSVRALREPDRNAILIVLFPHKDIWPDRQVIACGRTPEMARLWVGFLTLAGVPCRG